MRILHCFKVYRPDVNGGIEEAMSQLAAGTPADSQSSILVCRTRGRGDNIIVDGTLVERTTSFGQMASVPISPAYVGRLLRRMANVDVIVSHAPFPLVDLAILLGLRRDQALVIHWHAEIVGRHWIRPVFAWLMKKSLARADRILVTYPGIIDQSPYLPSVREKCSIIPYGVDAESWSCLSDSERAASEALRETYPRLIVACGRLVPYKGFDVLIRAMSRIDAHLILIGEGPQRSELGNLVSTLGLSGKVTFAGYLERDEQKRIMHAARVFVLPSITEAEAFGIVQLEAMSCGLPIVNTSLPTAVPEIARHEQEGLTVNPGDEIALAGAIGRLLDDRQLAEQLGRSGKARVAAHFSDRQYAATSFQAYREAFAARNLRRSAPRD